MYYSSESPAIEGLPPNSTPTWRRRRYFRTKARQNVARIYTRLADYLDNDAFEAALAAGDAEASGNGFLRIAQGLASKPNFAGYSYRDDMVGDAVLACTTYAANFKPGLGKAFAYFTQICYRAFQARIRTEQKQGAVKHRMLVGYASPAVVAESPYQTAHEKYQTHVDRVEELRMKRKAEPPQWEKLTHEPARRSGTAFLSRDSEPNRLRLSIAAIRLIGEAEYVEIFRLGKKLKISPADPDVEGVRRCYSKRRGQPQSFLLASLYPDLEGKVELRAKGGVLLGEIQ